MGRVRQASSSGTGTTSCTTDYASYTPVLNDFIKIDLICAKGTTGLPSDPTTPSGFVLLAKTQQANGGVSANVWTYGRFANASATDNPPLFSSLTSATWIWETVVESGLDPSAGLPAFPVSPPQTGTGTTSTSTLTGNGVTTATANDVVYTAMGARATSTFLTATFTGGSSTDVAAIKNGTNCLAITGIQTSTTSGASITPGVTYTSGAGTAVAMHSFTMAIAPATGVATDAFTFSGSSAASAKTSGTGSAALTGSGAAAAAITASGSAALSGSSTAAARVTGTGSVALSGTSSAQAATTSTNGFALTGSTTARADTTAAGAVVLTGTATGIPNNGAIGGFTFTGAAVASARTSGSGSFALTGSATSLLGDSAAGSFSFSGAATATVFASASDAIGFTGSALGHGPASAAATATGTFTVTGIGHAAGPITSTTYLFTPPQRSQRVVMHGRGLTYSYPVSSTVWKDADGVWHAQETPPNEVLEAASVLLAVSGRPQIVPAAIALELIAAGIGQCNPIS